MMRAFWIYFCLAAVFTAASARAADGVSIQDLNDETLEFADPEQCHIKVGENDSAPVIPMLVAAHSMETVPQKRAAIRVAIDTTLLKKCDIHETDKAGLQPLNAAILFGDFDMVRFLLKKGADPYKTIQRPDSPVNNMNSFDFLDQVEESKRLLAQKNGQSEETLPDFAAIRSELDQYR